jgi:hypothetical protein
MSYGRTQRVQLALTLPGVRLLVGTLNQAVAMDVETLSLEFTTLPKHVAAGDMPPTGIEDLIAPSTKSVERLERRLTRRKWRELRADLIALDTLNLRAVAGWLNRAGYVPRICGRDYPQWTEERVTNQVVEWLCTHQRVVRWLASRPQRTFRKVINKAWHFIKERHDWEGLHYDAHYYGKPAPRTKNPEVEFRKSLRIRPEIDLAVLSRCLVSAGAAPNLSASFGWDKNGRARIAVTVDSPMEAIVMSVHVDKAFAAVSGWAHCANCGKGFEQDRSTDRYCPGGKCKNEYITYRRRTTERADARWRALSVEKRKGKDRWRWIADWARRESKGKYQIDRTWARRLLTKTKAKEKERLR